VLSARVVQMIQDGRQSVDVRLVVGNLAIEYAQWIGRRSTLTIPA
jgi:hypothetical protein